MQGTIQPTGNVRFKARGEHAVSSALKDGSVSWLIVIYCINLFIHNYNASL